ncbi:16S rRNA (uracil(1498)-N(3))-methyltransferase [Parvularcula marina]|uniref:16S rRNA (uracil(1498)-N(3))-methyltransferase n=1 Tax=Parvularcula marina TaxID=2292771 RepID=UPI003512A48B
MAKPPPRLFLSSDLEAGAGLPLDGARWHYLHNVLRLGEGDEVLLFNGRDGEWRAHIQGAEKRRGAVTLAVQTREQVTVPDLTLLFAPLKKDPTELIIQKGTELGVRSFQPVVTRRTQLAKGGLKADRLETIAMEAAEQCERLDLPQIAEPVSLEAALDALPSGTRLVFCDEAGDAADQRWGGEHGRAAPMATRLADAETGGPWALLIGPEGGFSPEERAMLRKRDGVLAVSLGPRILKAETAAIAAITLWQAHQGDFR